MEVEQRFLLYLAANSSALDQANGSIGFVGGAAGRCLGYKHSPILAKSKPLWESKIDFCLILWDHIENPEFHINKINILPTPNRQNRLFLSGKCGTLVMSIVSDLSQYLGRYATCCKSKQLARNMLMSHFTVERGI